jgi:hypothetical protein
MNPKIKKIIKLYQKVQEVPFLLEGRNRPPERKISVYRFTVEKFK